MITIGMVIPTWETVCGVACYTKQLIEHTSSELTQFKIYREINGDFPASIKRNSVDIVHFQHEYSLYDFNTLYRLMTELKQLNIPVITTIHTWCGHLALHNKIISELSSQVIIHSDDIKQLHILNGCAPEKLIVMPMGGNSIPLQPKEQTKKSYNIDGYPCIGFFGFPFPHKGIVNLIYALNALKAYLPDLKGYFFATYPDYFDPGRDLFQKELQSKFDHSNHLIWIKDFLPEDILVNLLHCMDVNVLPYIEPSCQGISSASKMLLAARRPVITTNSLFFSDLRDEVYKIPDAVPDTIAISIHKVLSDSTLQERLIANGNTFLQNYSWDRIGSSYRELYTGVKDRFYAKTGLISTGKLPDKLPVRWNSSLYDPSGYACEARNILLHLNEEKYEFKVIPFGHREDTLRILNDEERNKLGRLIQAEDRPKPVNIVWLPGNYFVKNPNSRANIGRTMFETDRIPPEWVNTCNQMDEIWVPSHFNVETFSGAGVARHKIVVIPGGIDTQIYSSNITPMQWPDKRDFNFVSVFMWLDRKGWDVLLKAFVTEFHRGDDVALILKVNVPHFTNLETIKRQAFETVSSLGINPAGIPDIHLIPENYTDKEMAALYAACDAFILPSRGEGWGRPYMEAMAAGLPVIGTRWSGQLEFMHDENSYLINIDGLEDVPCKIDVPVYSGQRWARPSLEHTRVLMRHVYENRDEARQKGVKAQKEVFERWSLSQVVKKVETRLDNYR